MPFSIVTNYMFVIISINYVNKMFSIEILCVRTPCHGDTKMMNGHPKSSDGRSFLIRLKMTSVGLRSPVFA